MPEPAESYPRAAFKAALLVGGAVLLASWIGVLSRPLGGLAHLWPANAVLLGLMVRFPSLARPAGWLGALAGYLIADRLGERSWTDTLLLTDANLVGVVIGYLLFQRLAPEHRRLARPLSMLLLVLVVMAAAAGAGLVGAVLDPLLFRQGEPLAGWAVWFLAEAVSYMAFLPALLTLPRLSGLRLPRLALPSRPGLLRALPALTLLALCVLGAVIGGPGAIAVPVPALLWCAISYGLFANALLTLFYCCWTLVAISSGHLAHNALDMAPRGMLMSLRLGVMLIAIAPLTLAAVMSVRNELLRRLKHMADHDELSGLLNRRAFRERAAIGLARLSAERRPVALVVLDIDSFKRINEGYGHATGDAVLQGFARMAARKLREDDPFARIAGKQFAMLLPDCHLEWVQQIAERVRAGFSNRAIDLGHERQLLATVSIGVAYAAEAVADVDVLLALADRALHRAKAQGRNRVEIEGYFA